MREIKVSFSKHTKERGYYVTINDGKSGRTNDN
jgi:hypothetical protein